MVGRIACIGIVALVFYELIPILSAHLRRLGHSALLAEIGARTGFPGAFVAFAKDRVLVRANHPAKPAEIPMALVPQETVFLMVSGTGAADRIGWKSISMIEAGTSVMVYLPTSGHRRAFCVFHEGKNPSDLGKRITEGIAFRQGADPVKPFSIATGAFLEFALLLESLQREGHVLVSVLAILAVFGKALPWCPPGLLLTLLGHALTGSPNGRKKSRQYETVGFSLKILGVLLNVACILFVFRVIGLDFAVK